MRRPLTFKGPRGYNAETPPISVTDERDFITFGIGKRFDESFNLDIGYTHGFWSQDESPREDEENRYRIYVSLTHTIQQ